ncbi:MAG: NUDIX hydrolase, partial [Psychrilyobacter sp.]
EKLYVYIVKLKNNEIKPLELELDETEDLTTKWIDLEEMEKITTDMKSLLTYYMYMNKNKKK